MLKNKKSVLAVIVLLACGLLTSCAQNALQIGNAVNLCCPGNYDNYKTFGVTTQDMPLFLQDYVVQEFTNAFQERGLTRNDQINDLSVTLSYRHVNLDPEQQNIDPFIRQETIDVELHYIAVIDIVMRETATGKEVWAGQIHRIHRVSGRVHARAPGRGRLSGNLSRLVATLSRAILLSGRRTWVSEFSVAKI